MSIKNIFKSRKGQAFSTFQLLIAAVVALALLGVLMPIIMKSVVIGGDPIDATKTLLRSQINNPGSLIFTDTTTFSSKTTISASGLGTDAAIANDQLVFSTNGLDDDFSSSPNTLQYKNTIKKKFQIGILCETTKTVLETALVDDYGDRDYIDLTDDFDALADNVPVCVVFPIRATN